VSFDDLGFDTRVEYKGLLLQRRGRGGWLKRVCRHLGSVDWIFDLLNFKNSQSLWIEFFALLNFKILLLYVSSLFTQYLQRSDIPFLQFSFLVFNNVLHPCT